MLNEEKVINCLLEASKKFDWKTEEQSLPRHLAKAITKQFFVKRVNEKEIKKIIINACSKHFSIHDDISIKKITQKKGLELMSKNVDDSAKAIANHIGGGGSMKVFCEDCKWEIGRRFCICRKIISSHKVKTDNYYSKGFHIFERKAEPEKCNKENNCKYYKRKWWKFWIKER